MPNRLIECVRLCGRTSFVLVVVVGSWLMLATSLHAQADSSKDGTKNLVLETHPNELHVENLTAINSKEDDATPFIAADGSMYFTSSRDGKQSIFVARRSGKDTWSAPEKFFELPGRENVSSLSIAGDGVTAVMGCCNRSDGILGTCDIYQAQIIDGKVTNLMPLGPSINSEWWDGQPCISQDGQLLFFASDRKGGKGGIDIYMSAKTAEGKWGEPVDLGFNTGGNEVAPFISADNQTLYFASNDLPGRYGGYDIYVTHRSGPNDWSQPKNLGLVVNSTRDDLFFMAPQGEDAVYISSDRNGGEGEFDIYRLSYTAPPPRAKMVTLRGRILDAETGQPIGARPEIALSTAQEPSISNEATGSEYSVNVLVKSLVTLKVGAEGYVSTSMELQAPSTNDPSVVTQDIKLTPSHARIDGHVTNVFTHKALRATITFEEQNGGSKQSVTSDPASGAFALNVNPSMKYKVATTVDGYEPYESTVEIPSGREAIVRVEKEIRLQPVDIQSVMLLFDFNMSDLKPTESPKLGRFIQQVKENPYVRIEVNGHTDDVGTVEYNEKLSERRAITVENYLLSQGVPRDQLAVVKGFGKAQPIDPGISDQARARNRRVEVRIVGKHS